ncbi:MAG: histidine phosphatase family protein [Acidimicrobiales bacterium]|jgi:probable phosphoglycerate mutase|nr:histidine phosphatase family protein [Acidimicrobiales bacterium]
MTSHGPGGRTLVLVRHGETAGNRAERFVGSSDQPLTELGEEQARRLVPMVDGFAPDVVLASPLRRALRTAELASGGRALVVEPGLREVDFGAWEDRSFAEAAASHPEAFAAFDAGEIDAFPGGDTVQGLADRLVAAVAVRTERRVLAFTHATALRVLVCALLGDPVTAYRSRIPRPANGSWTQLELVGGAWRLDTYALVPGGDA